MTNWSPTNTHTHKRWQQEQPVVRNFYRNIWFPSHMSCITLNICLRFFFSSPFRATSYCWKHIFFWRTTTFSFTVACNMISSLYASHHEVSQITIRLSHLRSYSSAFQNRQLSRWNVLPRGKRTRPNTGAPARVRFTKTNFPLCFCISSYATSLRRRRRRFNKFMKLF